MIENSIYQYIPKVDITSDQQTITPYNQWVAKEQNRMINEINNLINSSGEKAKVIENDDRASIQQANAVLNYSLGANYYEDESIQENNIILNNRGTFVNPTHYFNGMTVMFLAKFNNTSSDIYVNVCGLGEKPIYKNIDFDFLLANTIKQDRLIELVYLDLVQGFMYKEAGSDKNEGKVFPLLTPHFFPNTLNEVSWLRSDTFSWQSGKVYVSAYNKLVEEKATVSQTTTETIGGVSITYYKSTNGFNIVDQSQEQNIIDLYNNTGIAWFYILDEINKKFKLPRTKYNFVGYRNNVGGYVEESLPNITGDISYGGLGSVDGENGALYNTVGTGNNHESSTMTQGKTINFDASRSSSTYQDDAPVQQRATEMYLYFYVGNTVRNQTEIDVGTITEELNNKVDTDLSNISEDGKQVLKQTCIGYPDYGAGVSLVFNQENIIPANGWLEITGIAFNTVQVIISINGVEKTLTTSSNAQYSTTAWVIIPVSAGDIIKGVQSYNNDGKFIFYPNK